VTRRILLIFALLFGHSASARAQAQYLVLGAWAGLSGAALLHLATRGCCGDVTIGTTVRFRDDRIGVSVITGVVRAIDNDSMTVAVGDSIWRGPLRVMQGLRSQATERRWAEGWGIGFVTGAALGTALGASVRSEPGDDLYITREGWLALGAATGAFVGSTIGTLIGTANTGRYWQSVPRSRLSATLLLSPGGRRVGLRMSFR
jgi:hypothetical protein